MLPESAPPGTPSVPVTVVPFALISKFSTPEKLQLNVVPAPEAIVAGDAVNELITGPCEGWRVAL